MALLDSSLRVLHMGFFHSEGEVINDLRGHGNCLVGIDAPLSLPTGLCCLEETCSCKQPPGMKGRICERGLAKMGIGSFFTTKSSIIKGMVYRGMTLKQELLSHGHLALEVYPYASKVRLFGKPIPPKNTGKGRNFLKKQLSTLIPSIGRRFPDLDHNLADAVIAAYTGYLYERGEVEAVGEPQEGLIFIPKKNVPRKEQVINDEHNPVSPHRNSGKGH
ncbi:MAG: DUF429 domain-containing protein [Chloroflexi bacterium]|nr:DUF429 domain-containing protein [Chloroflexota bacterium]